MMKQLPTDTPKRCSSVRSLCVASVALALVFMPGLYSPLIGLPFLCFYAVVSSLFLLFVFVFVFFCLAASSSSSLHAAMNLRPPSVTASTQISALNAIVFQSPVMPNARMSLCTQSVHSFCFPPCPLRTAPSRFQHACLVFVVDHTICMYGI